MSLTPKRKDKNILSRQCLTPVAERLSYQQVFDFGNKSLFRSMSLDRFTFNSTGKEKFTATQVAVSNFQLPAKRKIDFEPTTHMAKKRRSSSNRTKTGGCCCKMIQVILLLASIIAAVLVSMYFGELEELKIKWDTASLKSSLQSSLIAQDPAINIIDDTLTVALTTNQSILIIFTGGVGVGKTMTSTIIQESFPWNNSIMMVPAEILPNTDLSRLLDIPRWSLLDVPRWSLLVVENVTPLNCMSVVDTIKSFMSDSYQLKQKVLIILNYTSKSETDLKTLIDIVIGINRAHVPFAPLSRESVKQCFVRVAKKGNIELSEEDLATLVDEQMRYIKEVKGLPGCKQVENKLMVYKSLA